MNRHQRIAVVWAISIPVFFVLGQLFGYFIFWALGYQQGESVLNGPFVDRFIISIPVAALMLTPCVQAIRFGFAAKRTGGKRGFAPAIAGAIGASFVLITTLFSLLGLS
jgi:hypothetical protein